MRRRCFSFGGVRLTLPGGSKNENFWYLTEHPGRYELKVLRNGSLSRSVKFNVGENAKLENGGPGLAADDEVNGIVPAKILGAEDGKWDATDWRARVFTGNPLTGFAVPQN